MGRSRTNEDVCEPLRIGCGKGRASSIGRSLQQEGPRSRWLQECAVDDEGPQSCPPACASRRCATSISTSSHGASATNSRAASAANNRASCTSTSTSHSDSSTHAAPVSGCSCGRPVDVCIYRMHMVCPLTKHIIVTSTPYTRVYSAIELWDGFPTV